jgi:hypothetical protein
MPKIIAHRSGIRLKVVSFDRSSLNGQALGDFLTDPVLALESYTAPLYSYWLYRMQLPMA